MSDAELKLPADTATEKAILGAVLLEPDSWHTVSSELEPRDFFSESHRFVFEGMRQIATVRHEAIDHTSLRAELSRTDTLERAGGAAYLSSLIDGLPHGCNVAQYARLVRDCSLRRQGIRIASAAITRFGDTLTDPDEAIEEFSEDLRTLLARLADADVEQLRGSALLADSLQRGGRVPLGWHALDRQMRGGLPRGTVMTVGAKGSVGKTPFALQTAQRILTTRPSAQVVFFNLEMPGAEIVRRQIMAYCGVTDAEAVDMALGRTGRLTGMGNTLAEYDALMERFHMHNAQRTVAKIEAAVASIGGEVELVIVDHLGKLKAPGTKSPYDRVSTVIVDLQAMAAALNVPVMLLAHLNRVDNKSPADEVYLSSFRDSGVIEDQSDYVLGLWRPHYTEEVERQARVAVLRGGLLKNKSGYPGQLDWNFDLPYQQIQEVVA